MNYKIKNLLSYLVLILPITLISGPAIPDITISIVSIYFIYLLFNKNFLLNNINFNRELIYFSFFFWFFLLFVSLFSENKYLAYRDSIIFIRILLIPIFLYFWILSEKNNLYKITTIIFYTVLFVCFDTIYQFLNYNPELGFGGDIFGFVPDFYGRLSGPFYKELIPGSFISKFALLGLVYLFLNFSDNYKKKSLIIFYLSLVGITCFISGERMALATFLLGLLILLLFLNNKRLYIFISIIFIIVISSFIKIVHPIYNDYKIIESTPYHLGLKVEKEYACDKNKEGKCKKIIELQPEFKVVIDNFEESAYGQIYKLSLKMWLDHPFQGIGLNNFTYLCNNDLRYKNTIKNYNCVSHPHNFYIQWLVETGLFGFALFVIYLFLIFRILFKQGYNEFTIISLSTMVILFWPIMSTGSLLKNWMGISTFFIIGICICLNNIKQRN